MTTYCSIPEARARLGIVNAMDTGDDGKLVSIIDAVSALIDNYCGRRFYADADDVTRYFTAEYSDHLDADDLVSVTTLAIDNGSRTWPTTWLAADYDLTPHNAVLDGRPYAAIESTPSGRFSFPVGVAKSVKVVGKWGWPAIPAPIREACLLQVERLFKRGDAIFGVAGSGELGQMVVISSLDPDVKLLLSGYKKLRISGL